MDYIQTISENSSFSERDERDSSTTELIANLVGAERTQNKQEAADRNDYASTEKHSCKELRNSQIQNIKENQKKELPTEGDFDSQQSQASHNSSVGKSRNNSRNHNHSYNKTVSRNESYSKEDWPNTAYDTSFESQESDKTSDKSSNVKVVDMYEANTAILSRGMTISPKEQKRVTEEAVKPEQTNTNIPSTVRTENILDKEGMKCSPTNMLPDDLKDMEAYNAEETPDDKFHTNIPMRFDIKVAVKDKTSRQPLHYDLQDKDELTDTVSNLTVHSKSSEDYKVAIQIEYEHKQFDTLNENVKQKGKGYETSIESSQHNKMSDRESSADEIDLYERSQYSVPKLLSREAIGTKEDTTIRHVLQDKAFPTDSSQAMKDMEYMFEKRQTPQQFDINRPVEGNGLHSDDTSTDMIFNQTMPLTSSADPKGLVEIEDKNRQTYTLNRDLEQSREELFIKDCTNPESEPDSSMARQGSKETITSKKQDSSRLSYEKFQRTDSEVSRHRSVIITEGKDSFTGLPFKRTNKNSEEKSGISLSFSLANMNRDDQNDNIKAKEKRALTFEPYGTKGSKEEKHETKSDMSETKLEEQAVNLHDSVIHRVIKSTETSDCENEHSDKHLEEVTQIETPVEDDIGINTDILRLCKISDNANVEISNKRTEIEQDGNQIRTPPEERIFRKAKKQSLPLSADIDDGCSSLVNKIKKQDTEMTTNTEYYKTFTQSELTEVEKKHFSKQGHKAETLLKHESESNGSASYLLPACSPNSTDNREQVRDDVFACLTEPSYYTKENPCFETADSDESGKNSKSSFRTKFISNDDKLNKDPESNRQPPYEIPLTHQSSAEDETYIKGKSSGVSNENTEALRKTSILHSSSESSGLHQEAVISDFNHDHATVKDACEDMLESASSRLIDNEKSSSPSKPDTIPHTENNNCVSDISTDEVQNTESNMTCNMFNTGKLPTLGSKKNVFQNDTEGSLNDDFYDQPLSNHNEDTYVTAKTASNEIKKLIAEINAPAQIIAMGKEKPLTPREVPDEMSEIERHSHKDKSLKQPFTYASQTANHKVALSEGDPEESDIRISDLQTFTSDVMKSTKTEWETRFDNFEHIKRINKYVQEKDSVNNFDNKTPRTPKRKSPNAIEMFTEVGVFASSPALDSPYLVKSKGSSAHVTEKEQEVNKNFINKPRPTPVGSENENFVSGNEPNLSKEPSDDVFKHTELRLDSSEIKGNNFNDRQKGRNSAMLLTRTIETQTSFDKPQHETVAIPDSKVKRRVRSYDFARGFRTDSCNQTALVCSKCMQSETNVHNCGFCENCLYFLCSDCVGTHAVSSLTRKHNIIACYCKNELAVHKHVRATGYCKDCREVFCSKCANNHSRLRRYRHHRILQSSFVSKPTTETRKGMSDDNFTPHLQDQHMESRPFRESEENTHRRQSALTDQARYNPYRFAYRDVLPTLYPGPKKTISGTYTSNPKWPKTSFPLLPFLLGSHYTENSEVKVTKLHTSQNIPEQRASRSNATRKKLKTIKSLYGIQGDATTHELQFEKSSYSGKDKLPDICYSKESDSRTSKKSLSSTVHSRTKLKRSIHVENHCLSIPFPSCEKKMVIRNMDVLMNGKLVVLDSKNNEVKLYNKAFVCKAALQFRHRLVDLCASNLCETDMYAATGMYVYEISASRGIELKRKMKIEIRRIEGLACWKYGLAVVWKKTGLTWELHLMDYRGNVKSRLEVLNPLTCEIESTSVYYVTTSKRGKYLSITDTLNGCIITVDVIMRKIVYETALGAQVHPKYLTSDGENTFVSCGDKIMQVSKHGDLIGSVAGALKGIEGFRCVVYNKLTDKLYVQITDDSIAVYKIR